MKEYHDLLSTPAPFKKALREQILDFFVDSQKGQLSYLEFRKGLEQKIQIKEGAKTFEYWSDEILLFLEATRRVTSNMDVSQLGLSDQVLVTQLKRAVTLLPRFVALTALRSPMTPEIETLAMALNKEIFLIRTMLTHFRHQELKAHLDVIEAVVRIKKQNPELTAEEAFLNALKELYPESWGKKLQQLMDCVR